MRKSLSILLVVTVIVFFGCASGKKVIQPKVSSQVSLQSADPLSMSQRNNKVLAKMLLKFLKEKEQRNEVRFVKKTTHMTRGYIYEICHFSDGSQEIVSVFGHGINFRTEYTR